MRAMITKALATAARSIDPKSRTAEFCCSTPVLDSHDEVISADGWILNDFEANGVVLFAHNSRDLPVGKTLSIGVRNEQLIAKIEFATAEMNPKAEQVWKLVEGGFLKAISVGFVPQASRVEKRDSRDVLVWTRCLLKELSICPIGSNPEALVKALERGEQPGAAAASKLLDIWSARREREPTMDMWKELKRLSAQTPEEAAAELLAESAAAQERQSAEAKRPKPTQSPAQTDDILAEINRAVNA